MITYAILLLLTCSSNLVTGGSVGRLELKIVNTTGTSASHMATTTSNSEPSPTPRATPIAGNATNISSRRPPAIYSVSSDQTLSIFSGHENVVLMCTAIGHITGGYWEKVDGKVSLNHNKSKLILHNHKKATVNMTITRVHPIHSGKYHCVIFNQWGVVKSKDVQVTVKIAAPQVIIHPSRVSVVALLNVTMTCKALGYKVKYRWRRHKSNKIIGNHLNLTISEATPSDEDQYYCVAMTEGGYAFSNNVTLTVNDYINITNQPLYVVAAKGGSINISITAEGPGKENFSYHWRRRDDVPLSNTSSGTKTQNLTITSVTLADSGAYNCSVINQWGRRVDSDYTAITVLTLPVVTIYPNDTENITVPEESNVTLRCEAAGEGTFSYQWIRVSQPPPEVDLKNNNTYLTILNINVNDTGIYFCKVDNGGTSVFSVGVHVIVKRRPFITGVSEDQILNITNNTEKVVLMCEVTGDNIMAYWRRMDGSILPDHRNHTNFNTNKLSFTILRAHPHDSGDYQCVVHSPWGDAESNIVEVLIVAAPPVFIIQPTDIAAVALETITFNSEAEGFHVRYEWRHYSDNINNSIYSVKSNSSTLTLHSVTPLDEGHYCCVAMTGKDNHVFSNNAILTVNASCTASQKSEYIAAVNSSVMLNAIAEGPGNEHYKYHWGKINNDLLPNTVSGQDTPNLVITPASTFDKGLYYCNVTTQWGTTCTSNSGSLQVLNVELKLLIKSMVTLGSSVNFSCQSSILSPVIYQWEHNETLLHNETSAILRITNMQWDKTGVYCCTVTTKNNVSVKSPKGYLIIHGPAGLNTSNVGKSKTIIGKTSVIFGASAVVVIVLIVICCCCICCCCCCRTYHKTASQQTDHVGSCDEGPSRPEQTALATFPSNRIQVLVTGSESIIEIINALNPELHNLNIKQLLPYLYQIKNGLTVDEKQNLQLTGVTDYSKIQYLLLQLQSKNEETLLGFVKAIYKSCQEGGNGKHCEIIKLFQARGIVINELTSEQ